MEMKRKVDMHRLTGSGMRCRVHFAGTVILLFVPTVYAQTLEYDATSQEEPGKIESEYLDAIRPRHIREDATDAITTGSVILYGQQLAPPHQVTIRQNSLFLNGVQIDPPIMPPWKRRVERLTPSKVGQEMSDLSKRIQNVYRDAKTRGEPDSLQAAVTQYITEEEKSVQSSEWVGSDKLHIVMDNGAEFSIGFRERLSDRDPEEVRSDILRRTKQRYEAHLKSGSLLVVGYGPVMIVPAAQALQTREDIEKALRERSFERLERVLHHDELVREILFAHERLMREE